MSVCAACGLDCGVLLDELLKAGDVASRRAVIRRMAPGFEKTPGLMQRAVLEPSSGALWQADHIVPVAFGGGQCGLENLQTLCTPCHAAKSQREGAMRREASRKVADAKQAADAAADARHPLES